jgi:hypothetical protein
MPKLLHALFLALVSVALLSAIAPLRANPAIASKNPNCCAKNADHPQGVRCRKEMPRSTPERQCCATCVNGIAMIAHSIEFSIAPSARDWTFENFLAAKADRSDRPPVPVPRA